MPLLIKCKRCNSEFGISPSRLGKRTHCSRACHNKTRSLETSWLSSFVKGSVPWNRGRRLPKQSGKNHPNWKGDKVSYAGLHQWLRRAKGHPQICCACDSVKNVQWSNKSYSYLRDISDWEPLCASCHKKKDLSAGRGAGLRRLHATY